MNKKTKIGSRMFVELVGHPWNKERNGPPYLRFTDHEDKYLGSPLSLQQMLKLQKRLAICIKAEREARGKKRL